jgi:hypothetical protein
MRAGGARHVRWRESKTRKMTEVLTSHSLQQTPFPCAFSRDRMAGDLNVGARWSMSFCSFETPRSLDVND